MTSLVSGTSCLRFRTQQKEKLEKLSQGSNGVGLDKWGKENVGRQ